MSTNNLLDFSIYNTPVSSAPKYNNWSIDLKPKLNSNKKLNNAPYVPISLPKYNNLSNSKYNVRSSNKNNYKLEHNTSSSYNNQFEELELTPQSLVSNNPFEESMPSVVYPRYQLINNRQPQLSQNNTVRIDSIIMLIGILDNKINELKKSHSEELYKEVNERIKLIAVSLLKEQKSDRRFIQERNHFLDLVEEFNKINRYLYSPEKVESNMNDFLYSRLSNNNKRTIIKKNLTTKNDKLYITLSEKINELESLIQNLNVKDNNQIKDIKIKISDIEGIFAYLSGRRVNESFNILKHLFHTMTASFYTITVGNTQKNNFNTINVGNTKQKSSNSFENETQENKKNTKIQAKISNNSRELNIKFIHDKVEELYNSILKTSTGKAQISKYYINIKKYLKKCTITDEDILSMVEIINNTIYNMNNNNNNNIKVGKNNIIYGMLHSLNEIAINHKLKNKGKEIGKFIIGNEYKIKINNDYKLCEFIKYNKTKNEYFFCNNDEIIIINDPKKIKPMNYKESTVKQMFKFFKPKDVKK